MAAKPVGFPRVNREKIWGVIEALAMLIFPIVAPAVIGFVLFHVAGLLGLQFLQPVIRVAASVIVLCVTGMLLSAGAVTIWQEWIK